MNSLTQLTRFVTNSKLGASGGGVLLALGAFLLFKSISKELSTVQILVGFGLVILGSLPYLARYARQIAIHDFLVVVLRQPTDESSSTDSSKLIDEDVLRERRQIARTVAVPGKNAPAFDLFSSIRTAGVLPGIDNGTPMYLLDKDYRILDWNAAFSQAFDNTMEGRRGQTVLEWVNFLDNYKDVLLHGAETFKDPDNLPFVDTEEVIFTSQSYGLLHANKRAVRVLDASGNTGGWYVSLDLEFSDPEAGKRYFSDLAALQRSETIWTEYSISYDAVLTKWSKYNELMEIMIREDLSGNSSSCCVGDGSKVLDLGAGTGNLSLKIYQESGPNTLVYCLDNNPAMLSALRIKASTAMAGAGRRGGIYPIKQDIHSLIGVANESIDLVVMNNVLYDLSRPQQTLSEIYRVLKPGGMLHVSGPKRSTRIGRVVKSLQRELKGKPYLEKDLKRVELINMYYLAGKLYKWEPSDVSDMIVAAQFPRKSIEIGSAYDGEAMVVFARK